MLISILMVVFILSALLPNAAMIVTGAVRAAALLDGKAGAVVAKVVTFPLWAGAWLGYSARTVDTTKLKEKAKETGVLRKLQSFGKTGTED